MTILVNAKNFCKNIEIVDKSSFYKKDIKQMEKGTDIFNSIIMRKEAGMAAPGKRCRMRSWKIMTIH